MKINYIKSLWLVLGAGMLAGCSENSWNDRLDGFTSQPSYSEVVKLQFTLTKADYAAISSALQYDQQPTDEKNAAKAIATNQYFTQDSYFPSQIAVPALLNTVGSDYYVYDNGSTLDITFNQAEGVPAEISQIQGAPQWRLTSAQYQEVWGSSSDYVSSFSPSHPAENYLPGLIADNYPNAKDGDLVIVTYNTATENPVFGTLGSGGSGEEDGITSAIQNLSKGDMLSATAIVTAQSSAGLVLTDNAGSILYYNQGFDYSQYPLGTIVKVEGEVGNFNNGLQLTNKATLTTDGSESFNYPTPTLYTASMINDAISNSITTLANYVTIEGELSITTNTAGTTTYYNLAIDGTTNQGSITNPTAEIAEKLISGKSYKVTGYYVYVSSGKYFNVVPTKVEEIGEGGSGSGSDGGSQNPNEPTGVISVAEALDLINNGYTSEATVEGYIISIKEVSTQFGNATYDIADEPDATSGLTVYRGYYLNNEKFTSVDQIAIGGKVQVKGNLILYSGTTPEIATGNHIESYIPPTKSYLTRKSRAAAVTPVSKVENAVYQYNGSQWVLAPNTTVLNPSDYEAIGVDNNELEAPYTYLPLYLKDKFPYSVSGDEKFVAYNLNGSTCSCSLLLYDGSSWSINDNYLSTVSAQFKKTNGVWSFKKYLGEEVFTMFTGDKLILDCKYLLVAQNTCMEPVPESNNYGYPACFPVTIQDNQIVQPNDVNAFSFLTSFEYNGNTYTTPEGTFVIQDSNGRYMYLQGTYSSFNLRNNNPYVENDGTIQPGYLFTATKNSDNTWRITNTREEGIRTIYYSPATEKYDADFAAYTDDQTSSGYEGATLPFLFISEDDIPEGDAE